MISPENIENHPVLVHADDALLNALKSEVSSSNDRSLHLTLHFSPHPKMPTALPPTLNLPDLLSACPIKPCKNPHYEKGASESSSWINSYNVFSASKKAALARDYNELLVAHTYPDAGYEEFRTCCDFVNLLCT